MSQPPVRLNPQHAHGSPPKGRPRRADYAPAPGARGALRRDRERIARDLHDVVVSRLFATGLQLQGLSRQIAEPETARRLTAAVEDLDAAIRDIRTTISGLRHPIGDLVEPSDHPDDDPRHTRQQEPLHSAWPEACHDAQHDGRPDRHDPIAAVLRSVGALLPTPPRLHCRVDAPYEVPPAVRPHLLAVLREALTNVARHAGASGADVVLHVGEVVRLTVHDDGVGLAAKRRESGLRNLRERARLLGGYCDVRSVPGGGVTVEWAVPAGAPVGGSRRETDRDEPVAQAS